eukprot:scaffold181161_cov24-Tisochrysis_lutea.AAC.1
MYGAYIYIRRGEVLSSKLTAASQASSMWLSRLQKWQSTDQCATGPTPPVLPNTVVLPLYQTEPFTKPFRRSKS